MIRYQYTELQGTLLDFYPKLNELGAQGYEVIKLDTIPTKEGELTNLSDIAYKAVLKRIKPSLPLQKKGSSIR